MISNQQVIERVIALLPDVENPNQLAAYLSQKYGTAITRQQINQFQRATTTTITHLLLREILEHLA